MNRINHNYRRSFLLNRVLVCLSFLLIQCQYGGARYTDEEKESEGGIRVWQENPYYFEYHGKPILLLGASDYHNIFQRGNLASHLDSMVAFGGNYVRNTMASREITNGHRDLWPYKVVETTDDPLISIYDLDQWNEAYWDLFSRMLRETHKRGIIVEIELWERHDTYRTRDQAGWLRHPFNPDNNINFTQSESFLPAGEWTMTGLFQGHPFFTTVPTLRDNRLVLAYQKAYIDKILSYTKDYDHVLYNMNNETQEHQYFGEYWARYIRAWADSLGKHVELTDMQDNHDVTQAPVARVIDSDRYSFVDISQNNFQKGDIHWERIAYIRDYMKESPMPITNIKVYGTDTAPPPVDYWGGTDEAVARFWRNIIGGCASARFHRPPWGIGLNNVARASLKSARMMTDSMDFFHHVPANHLLSDSDPNEAYCMAFEGKEYMVYFPASGSISLQAQKGHYEIRWLDIGKAAWHEAENLPMPGVLTPPGDGHWAVLLKKI